MVRMNQDKIPHTNSRQRLVKGDRNNLHQSGLPSEAASSVVQESTPYNRMSRVTYILLKLAGNQL